MIICISRLTYCCYNEHKLPHGLQKYIFYNQNLENFSKLPIANKQLGTYLSKQITNGMKLIILHTMTWQKTFVDLAIFHAVAKVLCLIISITDTMLRSIIANLKCFMKK